MTTAELKKLDPQIKAYIAEAVDAALEERLSDTDVGLELRESFVRKLLAREKASNKKYRSLQEVKKNLGIE